MNFFPLWNSLRIALISSILIFFCGIFIAHLVRKFPRILKGIIDVVLTLPLVLPPTVCGYLLILLVGPRHPIGIFLNELGIQLFMDWKGGILCAFIVAFPLMYRTVRGSFEAFDENLANAGKTLGLSNTYIFWRIKIPACKNGILSGFVLSFARALGEYGATSMLCGYNEYNTATISTTVANAWNSGNDKMAIIWVLINVFISSLVLVAVNLIEKSNKGAK